MNMAMIQWHSKKQATVEGNVFGVECVAMKQGIDERRGNRYTLQVMGVGSDGPTYVYGDNMFAIHNTLIPKTVLKKQSNSIYYHFIRETVVMKECLVTHVPTLVN